MKEAEARKVGDYKGITLMSLYKVYATALAERLRKEIEDKRLIPPNQVGFRKGMGTIENIHTRSVPKVSVLIFLCTTW